MSEVRSFVLVHADGAGGDNVSTDRSCYYVTLRDHSLDTLSAQC